jgi:RHS repeat-associated protein
VELAPSGGQLEVIYDAEGERVGWYSAYSPGNGQWVFALVPFMGREIAEYSWTSWFSFNHVNALNSASIANDETGSLLEDMLYYPWGQIWHEYGPYYDNLFAGIPASQQGSNWADFSMFEAPYRFYAPNPGRWHSPDPLGGDITNPQSLNRYAYALNNPTSMVDPTGLQGCNPSDPQDCPGWCTPGIDCPCDPDPVLCFPPLPGGPPTGGGPGGGAPSGPPVPPFDWSFTSPLQVDTITSIWASVAALPPGVYIGPWGEIIVVRGTGKAPGSGGNTLPAIIAGGLGGAIVALLPHGYYFNPIDQAVNPYHSGQWNFRQMFNTLCSTHVTVDQTTGEVSSHVDTVNPVPLTSLLAGPAGTVVWPGMHWLLDVRGLYPSSGVCP